MTSGGKRPNAGRPRGLPNTYISVRIPDYLLSLLDAVEGNSRTSKIVSILKSVLTGGKP